MSLQTELVRLYDEYLRKLGTSAVSRGTLNGFMYYLNSKEIDGVHVHTVDNPEDSYCTYCRAEIHELAKKIRETIDAPQPELDKEIDKILDMFVASYNLDPLGFRQSYQAELKYQIKTLIEKNGILIDKLILDRIAKLTTPERSGDETKNR